MDPGQGGTRLELIAHILTRGEIWGIRGPSATRTFSRNVSKYEITKLIVDVSLLPRGIVIYDIIRVSCSRDQQHTRSVDISEFLRNHCHDDRGTVMYKLRRDIRSEEPTPASFTKPSLSGDLNVRRCIGIWLIQEAGKFKVTSRADTLRRFTKSR